MMHRRARVLPALASVLAVGLAMGGCGAATATTAGAPARPASASAASAAQSSAPFNGPPAPDPACVAARKAAQVLQARQGKDQQSSQSAIDKDFTDFASALNAAAQHETRPAVAKVMTALADDYTALVESQSGAVPLPSMSTVQNDGAAFNKACP
jgi:hypothetical protein